MGELQHLKDTGVKDVILQSCIPSVDYPVFHDPEMKAVMAHHGWFFTAGLRKANAQRLVSAVPQHSTSILRKTLDRIRYEGRRPVLPQPYLPWMHGAIVPFHQLHLRNGCGAGRGCPSCGSKPQLSPHLR